MVEINAIAEVLLDPNLDDRLDGSIHIEKLKTWLHSDDAEVLGAMYVFLSEQRFFRLSEETLAFDDYLDFLKRYYRICLDHNPDGEWSDS